MITVIENQSVPDVIAQNYGSLEAAFSFLLLNDLSLTDDLVSNDQYEVSEDVNRNLDITEYFQAKKIQLATGYPLIDEENVGIGVMIIGQTFIIH